MQLMLTFWKFTILYTERNFCTNQDESLSTTDKILFVHSMRTQISFYYSM